MKYLYLILFLILLNPFVRAQGPPCPPNGISTDPGQPVNTLHPNNISFFDWRDGTYDVHFSGGAITSQVNPYYTNSGGVTNLQGSGDYLPEDGWELLYLDIGKDRNGTILPSGLISGQLFIILYNKYRSIIRVFVAIDQLNPGNLVEVELSMTGAYNSALLASISKIQQPLKYFDPSIVVSNTQEYTNGGPGSKLWHYADFPVNYDPCTCQPPVGDPNAISNFRFRVNLIDQANIQLTGTSSGTITMAEKSDPATPSTDNWSGFYGSVKKGGGLIDAGKKGYKLYSDFKSDADNSATGTNDEGKIKTGITGIAGFLTDNFKFLKYVPYISEALGIIDFFIGGGKKDETKFPPMAIQLEHEFAGTISSSFNYINNLYYTPGSQFTPVNGTYDDGRYPFYNEILGVYTLLEKPKVRMWRGKVSEYEESQLDDLTMTPLPLVTTSQTIRRGFTFNPNSIQIAVNPASGLTLSEAYLQLTYKKSGTSNFVGNMEGAEIDNDTWVSPLVPVACAQNRFLSVDISRITGSNLTLTTHQDVDVKVSTIMVFKSSNGGTYLHKATWDTDLETVNYTYGPDLVEDVEYHPPHPSIPLNRTSTYDWSSKVEFEDLEFGFHLAGNNVVVSNGSFDLDERAVETIEVSNATISSSTPAVNNGITDYIAGQGIEVLPSSEILPKTTLQISAIGMECNAPIPLATNNQISTVCNSAEYQGQKDLLLKRPDQTIPLGASSEPLMEILTFPNPATDYLNISLSSYFSEVNEIGVYVQDMSGRIVILNNSLQKEDARFILDTRMLTPGMYLLNVEAGPLRTTEKIWVK